MVRAESRSPLHVFKILRLKVKSHRISTSPWRSPSHPVVHTLHGIESSCALSYSCRSNQGRKSVSFAVKFCELVEWWSVFCETSEFSMILSIVQNLLVGLPVSFSHSLLLVSPCLLIVFRGILSGGSGKRMGTRIHPYLADPKTGDFGSSKNVIDQPSPRRMWRWWNLYTPSHILLQLYMLHTTLFFSCREKQWQ